MNALVKGLAGMTPAATLVLVVWGGLARAGDGVDWIRDHEAGMRRAKEDGKAVFLYVARPGSEPDRVLAEEVFGVAAFVAATDGLVAIRVERGIAAEKKPGDVYPADGDAAVLVFLTPDGSPIVHVVDRTGRTLSAATWTAIAGSIAAAFAAGEKDETLEGRLELRGVEGGVRVLVAGGTTYCLHGDLPGLQAGDDVVVIGRVRRDLACMHMTGPIFEVKSARRARP